MQQDNKGSGFIVLYRSLINWEWYKESNTFRLFIHCLLKANHKDKKWQGQIIKRGSFITSLAHLSKETGLTVRQVRTSLNHLKTTQELTSKTTSRNTVITVNNYNLYQDYDNQTTTNNNEEQVNNKTNLKVSLEKKSSSKKFIPPQLSAVESYCNERNNGIDPQKFVDFYEARGWMYGKTKIKDWKAAVRTWEHQKKQKTPAAQDDYYMRLSR